MDKLPGEILSLIINHNILVGLDSINRLVCKRWNRYSITILPSNMQCQPKYMIPLARVAELGIIPLMRWLLKQIRNSIRKEPIVCYAALRGKIDMMKYLIGRRKYPCGSYVLLAAISSKSIDTMRYLMSRGCEVGSLDVEIAARNGDYNMFIFLLMYTRSFDHNVYTAAVCGGNMQIIQHLHDSGCKPTLRDYDTAIWYGHIHVLELIGEFVIPDRPFSQLFGDAKHLSRENWIRMAEYLYGKGYRPHPVLYEKAICCIDKGKLYMFEWLRGKGVVWNPLFGLALFCEHNTCNPMIGLRWLRDNGFELRFDFDTGVGYTLVELFDYCGYGNWAQMLVSEFGVTFNREYRKKRKIGLLERADELPWIRGISIIYSVIMNLDRELNAERYGGVDV